jgi:hypothetical protein
MAEAAQPQTRWFSLSTWKDLISVSRDTFLLSLVVLMLVFPIAFNDLLVKAGFEEGSFIGFKWKAHLVNSDLALNEARAVINNLTQQNEKLSKALAEAQVRTNDPIEQDRLAKLEEENKKIKQASEKVVATVQGTIASNAALVEKAQSSTIDKVQWGVVYGGDTSLEAAKYEVGAIAQKYEIPNASIFFRQGSFRSVAIASDRADAEQLLAKAKSRRGDAYIVNMNKWCPRTEQKTGYAECINI